MSALWFVKDSRTRNTSSSEIWASSCSSATSSTATDVSARALDHVRWIREAR